MQVSAKKGLFQPVSSNTHLAILSNSINAGDTGCSATASFDTSPELTRSGYMKDSVWSSSAPSFPVLGLNSSTLLQTDYIIFLESNLAHFATVESLGLPSTYLIMYSSTVD